MLSKYKRRAHIQNTYQRSHNQRVTGSIGERIAREYLQHKGYVFRVSNEHTLWGEIDLIMEDPRGVPTFVEVKLKRSGVFGSPEDQFHVRKQQKLKRAIEMYCLRNRISRYQVDLVAIEIVRGGAEIRHYPNVELKCSFC